MKLKQFLELPGVSSRKVAARAGVSATALGMFARGERSPTLKTAMRIVEATGGVVGLDDLAETVSEATEAGA